MTLDELKLHHHATVVGVSDTVNRDPVSRRLRELGFVPGEPVSVVARGVFGFGPLLVQIGSTRFALRKGEALRISVEVEAASGVAA